MKRKKNSWNNPKKKKKSGGQPGRRKPKPSRSFFDNYPESWALGVKIYPELVMRYQLLGIVREWSENNPCGPHEVSYGCDDKFEFDCSGCGHTIKVQLNNIMNGQGCGHCSNHPSTPLCGDIDCYFCLARSFSNVPDAPYFQQKLREFMQCVPCNPNPHEIKMSSNELFNFQCESCPHIFPMRLGDVTNSQDGCGFCANKKRCGKPDCDFCTAHSVAANPIMLSRWDHDKNDKTPYEVALNDHKNYFWKCEHGHDYPQRPDNANNGHGCPDCKNKTEALIREFLTEQFGKKCFGVKSFEWCKNIIRLRFDFNLKQFMIIIECDGRQHYFAVAFFNKSMSLVEIQARDRYKEQCAIEHGFCVIRIKQEDVWFDRNNWREKLLAAIEKCRRSSDCFVEILYPELVLE